MEFVEGLKQCIINNLSKESLLGSYNIFTKVIVFCGICHCFNERDRDKDNFETVGCFDWKNILAKCNNHNKY